MRVMEIGSVRCMKYTAFHDDPDCMNNPSFDFFPL